MISLWASIAWAGCCDAATRWPDDYSSQVACARAWASDGYPDAAATVWERAFHLSEGREAATGWVAATLDAGRVAEARARTADWTSKNQSEAWVWLLDARARAGVTGDPTWAARRAETSMDRSLSLAPHDAEIACGDAIGTVARGGARPAVAPSCPTGSDRVGVRVWTTGGGTAWKANPIRPFGSLSAAWGTRRTWVGLTARSVAIEGDRTDELWAWGGVRREHAAASVFVGWAEGPAVAATGSWLDGPFGAQLGLARTSGTWQSELSMEALLSSGLRVSAGPRVTTWQGQVGVAVEARLTAVRRSLRVELVGRAGTEHRPFRFDGPALYSLDAPSTGSVGAAVWHGLGPRVDLGVGVDALRVGDTHVVLSHVTFVLHPGERP